ncbi:MAG: TetR/AcrR family transcriptional regulator [Elusimicrobia bacterium]|nr:TetR/AcrR family transcriptional regulator [Elusimicrobiota bacterium]
MSRTRSEPLEVRRRRVMEAAAAALVEKGYHDVKLEDIAKRAGLSKGALYLYFKDKEDIFAAVLSDVVDRIEGRLLAVQQKGPALEALSEMASALLDCVDAHTDFLIQFSRETPNLCGEKAGKVLQDRFTRVMDHIADRVQRCVRAGDLKRHDRSLGSLFFFSLLRMLVLQKIVRKTSAPLKNQTAMMMDLFLNGLGKR